MMPHRGQAKMDGKLVLCSRDVARYHQFVDQYSRAGELEAKRMQNLRPTDKSKYTEMFRCWLAGSQHTADTPHRHRGEDDAM